ncbi:MAG: hypothetical protein NZV14_17675 [Bryobacteraceae bacterium]|nr:hypothetical protein [Bryobacteraceae bacterium]MDW8379993.1 hypothetical protein [Bryobacterales bacterium]
MSPQLLLFGLALAFGFGALHALSPGHGKTIVAAYLVGSRSTLKHALLLGAVVTLTHTASVFALGFGTLFFSRYVVPDKIIPALSVLSGLMIVVVGVSLLYRRLQQLLLLEPPSPWPHQNPADRNAKSRALVEGEQQPPSLNPFPSTDTHPHFPGPAHHPTGHSHELGGEVSLAGLLGLAISGGLVPCPSALVLLLSAIALGRTGLGLALLTSFSLGLAAVLIALGCLALYARHLLPRIPSVATPELLRIMPVISAGVITVVGLILTAVALGWLKPALV